MSKIERYTGNLAAAASDAIGTERTVFGDVAQSDTLDDNINADLLRGWGIVGVNENPTKQDFNALAFTATQLIAYIHQMGVPEWDNAQEFNIDSFTNRNGILFRSKTDANIGNDPETDDGTNWSGLDAAYGTVAEMKLANPQVGQKASTRSYYAPIVIFANPYAGGGAYIAAAPQAFDTYGDHEAANGNIWVLQTEDEYNTRQYGVKGDGSTDDTAAIAAVVAAGDVGATILFFGSNMITDTIAPLSKQTWKGGGSDTEFYFNATSSNAGIQFTTGVEGAVLDNFKFRSVAGFTGQAVRFFGSINCLAKRLLITNILNGTGVQFSGGAFFNKLEDSRITVCDVGIHVTGSSPDIANNSSVTNVDIYGSTGVGTGILVDGNVSLFTFNNTTVEADCTVATLKVTGESRLAFNNPRFENAGSPSEGFFSIVDGARVTFDGQKFNIQKAAHASLSSDLDEIRFKNTHNQIIDPLFVQDLDAGGVTPPLGWAITLGSISAIAKSTSVTPGVGVAGSSLKLTTSAASTVLSYSLSSAAIQALARGKLLRVHALAVMTGAGTDVSISAKQSGGTGGTTSQTSTNTESSKWKVHTVEVGVVSDATTIALEMICNGSGGDFYLWSPVLEVDGSFYSMAHPTQEKPWMSNGFFYGSLGLTMDIASAAPTTGTWKRGDRIFNRFPSVGQPKSWVCTVAGTPGTWVSEGNL